MANLNSLRPLWMDFKFKSNICYPFKTRHTKADFKRFFVVCIDIFRRDNVQKKTLQWRRFLECNWGSLARIVANRETNKKKQRKQIIII